MRLIYPKDLWHIILLPPRSSLSPYCLISDIWIPQTVCDPPPPLVSQVNSANFPYTEPWQGHDSFPTHAWRSPWTEEPGGLQSMRWQRVRDNWMTKDITTTRLTYTEQSIAYLWWSWKSLGSWKATKVEKFLPWIMLWELIANDHLL